MRSKDLQLQFERALAVAEAQRDLLREQLALQEQRRQSDREWFEEQFERLRQTFMPFTANVNAAVHEISGRLTGLGEKLDLLHEQAGVPARDIPTIDELLDEARTDPVRRKLLQNTLAELEFENTEVDFN